MKRDMINRMIVLEDVIVRGQSVKKGDEIEVSAHESLLLTAYHKARLYDPEKDEKDEPKSAGEPAKGKK